MYENVGQSIKRYAVIQGALSIVVCSLAAVICLVSDMSGWIVFACIVAGFAGVISTWPLYAFGQMAEDMEALREAAQYNALIVQELRLLREQLQNNRDDIAAQAVSDELPDL